MDEIKFIICESERLSKKQIKKRMRVTRKKLLKAFADIEAAIPFVYLDKGSIELDEFIPTNEKEENEK